MLFGEGLEGNRAIELSWGCMQKLATVDRTKCRMLKGTGLGFREINDKYISYSNDICFPNAGYDTKMPGLILNSVDSVLLPSS